MSHIGTMCDGGGRSGLTVEHLAVYLEERGGLGFVAAATLESHIQDFTGYGVQRNFIGGQADLEVNGGFFSCSRWRFDRGKVDMFRPDEFIADHDGGVFEHIAQLANVSRPGVASKKIHGLL